MLAAFHRFLLFHDDSKLFVFGYVAAAVVLALWLGLFWLAVVVLVHLLFEMVKQHYYDPRPLPMLTRSLWELKLDLGLVLFGIVIGLYMGVIVGAAGIGAAGRVGVQAATRVGIWQRGLRGLLLSLDDVAMVVKARSVNPDDAVMVAGTDPGLAAPNTAPESGAAPESGGAPESGCAPESGAGDSSAAHDHVPVGAPPHAGPPHPPPEPPTSGSALWGKWTAPRWSRGDRFSIGFTVASALLILATPLLTNHTVASTWAAILHELRPF